MRGGAILFPVRIAAAFLTAAVLCSGCSAAKPVTESVRFAILGNTSPDSPFAGFPKTLPEVLQEIENRKPQIIIHTGNAVYGGTVIDGILESDVKRQLNIFFPMLKSLHTAVYTIPGEKDYFNGSLALYSSYTGKKSCYSFNYGSIHFICLSSKDTGPFIDDVQLKWLKNDLIEFSDSSAIFVFAHHQLFPERKKGKEREKSEDLHKLFIRYRVTAVFSGSEKDYSTKLKDSVRYINAGCTGAADKKKGNRFYIVNFSDNDISIDPVK